MREHILRFNTNSDMTAIINTGASIRFVFVILILFAVETVERLTLDPSIRLLRLIALVSTYFRLLL